MPWRNQMLSEEQKQDVASRQASPQMVVDIISGKYAQDGRYVHPKIVQDLMQKIAGATDAKGDNPYITNLEQLGHTYDPTWFTNYIKPGAVSLGAHGTINDYLTKMGPIYGYEEPYALMDQYKTRPGVATPIAQRYLDSLAMQKASLYNQEQFNPITRRWQPLDVNLEDQIYDGLSGIGNLNFSVDPSALDNYPMGMAPLPIGAYPYARSYAPAEGEASLYGQSYAQQYAPDESSGQGFFSKLMDVIGKGLANWPDKTMPYVVSPEVAEGVTNTATQGRDIPNSISVDFYREASDFGLTPPEYEQLISEVTSLVRKNKNNAPVLNQIFQELAKSGLTVQALDTLRPDWWVKLRRELTQG